MKRTILVAVVAGLGLTLAATPAAANRDWPPPDSAAAEAMHPDYAAAQEALDAGDYDTAIERLERLVAAEPDDADGWSLLGYSHRKLQNFDLAFGYYERALAIDPDHRDAHAYIGEAYLEAGDPEKAEAHLDRLGLICILGCDQYDQLEEAVKLYRANHTG